MCPNKRLSCRGELLAVSIDGRRGGCWEVEAVRLVVLLGALQGL